MRGDTGRVNRCHGRPGAGESGADSGFKSRPPAPPPCTEPAVYVTGRHGSWSICGCGWIGGLVHGGAIGATVAWALHVADVSGRRSP